jgi:DNA-binding CsgD family transcriptional regulator/tetratricopeptide (TPR) repeat protein
MTPGSADLAASQLVGREVEAARVDAMLERLAEGGAALLVSGEAGVGKSALLDYARARADGLGLRALSSLGVEAEAELAYAGLHQLLVPVLGLVELLPAPQRRALEVAFGVASGPEPDLFLVALAAYQLVCDAAEERPLVILADDAHWLDHSTAAVLTFIARRLESEPVGLFVSVRSGFATPLAAAGLAELALVRLSPSAAGALLDRIAPDLHPVPRARVLAEAAGNPLALVELGCAQGTAGGGDGQLSDAPLPLTARLERAFAARLGDLPDNTRVVLLAAALDGRASLEELFRSASTVVRRPLGISDLDPAVAVALVSLVDGQVRFRHPLVRSAVRQAAPPAQVLEMYGALAKVVADPDRGTWHRAMAAVGYDEEVAAALDLFAVAARKRGAVLVAASVLERAAALTADPHRRGERLVRAADAAYELGAVDVVRRLLEHAEPLDVGELEAARLAWLQQMVSGDVWSERGAAKTFVAIARRARDAGDADIALGSLVPIAHRCWWTRCRPRTRKYVVDAAREMEFPDDDPRLLAVMALADPEATGRMVLLRVSQMGLHSVSDPLAAIHVGIAAEKAGDFEVGARFLGRALERLREQGRLGLLTQALVHYAWAATHAGAWSAAAAAGSEAARLARDTDQPQFGLTGELIAGLVAGLRGEPDLEERIAAPERALRSMRSGPLLAPVHLARGAAALGEGRYGEAFRHLWPVFDEPDPAFHRFMRWPAVLDLVESAARGGQLESVAGVMAELEAIGARSGPPLLLVLLACARPLLADDEDAEALFEVALGQDRSANLYPRARTLFSFGSWLRRQRRDVDSRAPLREAIELFDVVGATRWSNRARQELRATGETLGPRPPDARDRLTAQELQIAGLAARGLTNREIGERLFLSHRTIGSHLYRIFPKLGITSRTQLRDALPPAADS